MRTGSAITKAIDYSFACGTALARHINDAMLPADNGRVENQPRPIALGRSNRLFAGSLHAGQPAAAIIGLMHRHDSAAMMTYQRMRFWAMATWVEDRRLWLWGADVCHAEPDAQPAAQAACVNVAATRSRMSA